MNLINKNILLISPEPWDHIFVSKHHYAVYLAKRGNSVFFLNPPTKDFECKKTKFDNVYSVFYSGFIKGLRFLPIFLQKYEIEKVYHHLERNLKVEFDIIWSFDNSVFFDFSEISNKVLKISHIVDLNQNFQTERAASSANICFAVSERILQRLKRYNKNSYFINHGYNYSKRVNDLKLLPGKNLKKVIYSGNLSMPYLDWELLNQIVELNSEVVFIFIGPGKDDFNERNHQNIYKKRCLENNNVFSIGRVDSSDLMSWYLGADILIISYQERYHNEQSNPHKMMEYLGSGKMIVSTKSEEYKQLGDDHLIMMSNINIELLPLFSDVKNNLSFWNSPKKREGRIRFAVNNTYECQIQKIENIIKKIIY